MKYIVVYVVHPYKYSTECVCTNNQYTKNRSTTTAGISYIVVLCKLLVFFKYSVFDVHSEQN